MNANADAGGRHANIAAMFERACRLEIEALKPGNVGLHGAGHGMTASDFLRSAAAAAAPLCRPGAGVGARILAAIEATRSVVDCNTNLGIVLLCAPLARAAEDARTVLRDSLRDVVQALDRNDAVLAYRAIRLAQPGGLGRAAQHDVAMEPEVDLRTAMAEARERDSIARMYASDFAELFDVAVPQFVSGRARLPATWAVTRAYLGWLARRPDSLVQRKQGLSQAILVQSEAARWVERFDSTRSPETLQPGLLEWDTQLKGRGINPGTSADLTVATVFAATLDGGRVSG